MKALPLKLLWAALLFFLSLAASAQEAADPLKNGFEDPPNSARPRVWWHWMNGNITKDGIKLDLEWMSRVGLGGFQAFDVSFETPQVVEKRLPYMTPEWRDAFAYATRLADELHLEEAIASSPGYTETGGPWVPPSQGMKKYVWSETRVEGGKAFTGVLPKPPSVTGEFQNIAVHDALFPAGVPPLPAFYADSAVIAYRVPANDVAGDALHPKITWSGGTIDAAMLSDGDLNTPVKLPMPAVGGTAWIAWEFAKPQAVRALTIAQFNHDPYGYENDGNELGKRTLEASDDGRTFRLVLEIPNDDPVQHTLSFAPVTARFFRVSFERKQRPGSSPEMVERDALNAQLGLDLPYRAATDYLISELVLHPDARVNRLEDKAGFLPSSNLYSYATGAVSADDVVRKSDVVDLTSRMRPDGTLDWTPPAGTWIVLRFGYSLLGMINRPAVGEATGLEVDKLNRDSVKNYFEHYLDLFQNTVGADWMGRRGIRYVVTDSWEAGAQNWTDDMIAQFTARRGYDPRPWMPVLAGRIVESASASDKFLWDLRKTIADLIADAHYGQIAESLKARGMGHYGESHEVWRATIADGMEVKKLDEVPMGAMWLQRPGVNKEQPMANADDRESASVAHLYGQNLVAAESMTSDGAWWAWSPATMKPTADKEFAEGINRIVVHSSIHQPLVGKAPGLTLGPFGQWFNRNDTWAEQAGPWVTYLARNSYLLQQGRFAADVLYYYGEDTNLTSLFTDKGPEIPAGYGFDYLNADALVHVLRVKDGCITTASGMRYRVLVLGPNSVHMSLPVLRRIRELVNEGAVVAGPMPMETPSLADDEKEFREIAQELWGSANGAKHVGKGATYTGVPLTKVFAEMHLGPDFEVAKLKDGAKIDFVHRTLEEGELYYLDNRSDRAQEVQAIFRVNGKAPELWYADTGKTEAASYTIAKGRTTVPLRLEPWGTVFVLFRKAARSDVVKLTRAVERPVMTLNAAWNVSFQGDRGAPASVRLEKLISWSECADAGVKYFSGTGTYAQSFVLPAVPPGTRLWLDLGEVKNMAEVSVNGKALGLLWHAPYRVDATEALKAGANEVTIKVTNAWVNRLIGDEQPGATKYTFTVIHPYRADSKLLASGLLGPVRVVGEQ